MISAQLRDSSFLYFQGFRIIWLMLLIHLICGLSNTVLQCDRNDGQVLFKCKRVN